MPGKNFMVQTAEQAGKDLAEACDSSAQTISKNLISKVADTEEGNLGRTLEGEAKNAQGFTNLMGRFDGAGDEAAGGIKPGGGSGGLPKGGGNEDVPNATGGDPFHESTPVGDRPTCETDPVDPSTGDMLLAQIDARVPGVLDLVLERVHISSYRKGRLFGRSWASSLDQRVQVDEDGVHYFAPDGVVLHYPVPTVHGQSTLPSAGARWPLSWDRAQDRIVIEQIELGRVLEFPPGPRPEAFRPLGAVVDRNGNRVTLVCDAEAAPTDLYHSGGVHLRVTTIETREGVRVSGIGFVGAQGERPLREFRYDTAGRLVEIVDSSRRPHCFEYDDQDRITAWIDRIGYRYAYTYDEHGRVVATGGEDGALAGRIAYDPGERVTRFTTALGETTSYRMDEYGHVVETVDPVGGVRRTESDRYGRVLSHTDELDGNVRVQRDERGDAVRVERPDGSVLAARYNALRQPVELIDADGSRWSYAYDEWGNLLAATDPIGAVTRYEYNERGALTAVLDALGQRTEMTVDAAGLPTAITAATGAVMRLERDERGRVVRIVDPVGEITALGYDDEDRHVSRTFPDGASETWSYDAAGNLLAHTDQAGLETRFEAGPFRMLTARTDPDGTRHAFEYDSQLRLTAVTNPAGLRWTYAFDAAGRLVGETDFNNRTLTYRHDAAGRVVERVNGAGQHVELVRDALGRVLEQRVDGEHAASFAYDANGNLTAASTAETELRYRLDGLGRVLEESIDGFAVRTAYDALGQVLERTTPSSRVSTWRYDPLGLPVEFAADGRERLAFGHDAFGRETYRWLSSNTALTQEFDAVGRTTARRLLAVEAATPSAPTSSLLLERSWTYRADDTPTSVTDSFSGATQFQLDALGRVTAVTGASWNETYAYDMTGNIASDGDGPRELTGTLLRTAGRTRYDYDGQGRLTRAVRRTLSGTEKAWEYVYDAFDRLVEASTPDDGRWRYRYDPLGRRVAKQRLGADGTAVEEYRFYWDGTTLAEQRHEITGRHEVSVTSWDYEPGGFTPIAQVTRTLLADASAQEIERRFHAIVTDLVGMPTELVTPDGDVEWRHRARLWGAPAHAGATESELDCPLRFPGQYHDAETGLHYNYERYYDPGTGRYLSPDPLGLDPAPNHHGYVANPVSHLDPLGLRDFLSDEGRNKLRQIAARHGGVELPDDHLGIGNFEFPNRRAARAAASEVAGDLGSQAKPITASSYRGAPRGTNPNKVMGQSNGDPSNVNDNHGSAGWRDDQWGHDFGGENKVGPHVNAWNDANGIGNSHLHYKVGGGPCP